MASVPAYCEASLNYARGMELAAVPVTIYDGRAALAELDYERCGFTLLEHHSAVRNWHDLAELERVHVPEIEALAATFTGCDRTVAYPPLLRSPAAASGEADFAPIESVHSDYTDDYRPMISEPDRPYRAFLDPLLNSHGLQREDVAQAERVLMLQFWRNLGDPHPDRPFALCDAETVSREELGTMVVPEYGGVRLDFETFFGWAPTEPERHRWYTFPELTADEVIAFRTYDSRCEDEGRAFWTLHSAFQDPRASSRAPARESLEMRVLCLFGL